MVSSSKNKKIQFIKEKPIGLLKKCGRKVYTFVTGDVSIKDLIIKSRERKEFSPPYLCLKMGRGGRRATSCRLYKELSDPISYS